MSLRELNYPLSVPSFVLNFAGSKQLDPRVTFNRNSSATYTDSDGLIKPASLDIPRFDHDPVTGQCLGLLVESQKTNLLLKSEDLNDSPWIKSYGVSVTSNYNTAPSGDNTADLITYSTLTTHLYQEVITNPNTMYVFSVYLRAVSGTFKLKLSRTNGFTWTTATVSDELTITTQWQRFSLKFTTGSGENKSHLLIGYDAKTGYNLPSTGSVLGWGAQLESGRSLSSYIPTFTSQVTRAADLASLPLTGLYNQTSGTFMLQFKRNEVGDSTSYPAVLKTESLLVFSDGQNEYVKNQSINEQLNLPLNPSQSERLAISYSSSGWRSSLNTSSVVGRSVPFSINVTTLQLGYIQFETGHTMSRISYWSVSLNDSALQGITT